MSGSVLIPVSVSELFDKIGILEIKAARILDNDKLKNINLELSLLKEAAKSVENADGLLDQLREELKTVNEALWDCEESIREHERSGDYGQDFIAIARAIHRNNDKRAEVKKRINLRSGSSLVEEKSYRLPGVGAGLAMPLFN